MLTETQPTFTLPGAPYLEFLPIIDLSTGRLLGMEALVRWNHPTLGLISPDQLIPQAEQSGDIGPLTRWILMEACQQAKGWSPSVQLGVNCTIEQLRRGEVSKAVETALEQTGFASGQLTVEVSEDAIIDPSASSDLKAISQMGVQLSVDDAGTNWSSFEPFKRHSIGTVKIDGPFIAGLESNQGINRLVVETVIKMAHSLGMSAIVEWVETEAQVDIVRSFHADAAQGFFFSRPMSGEEAAAMAAGPDIPRFSRTQIRTLMGADEDAGESAARDGEACLTAGGDTDALSDADGETTADAEAPSDADADALAAADAPAHDTEADSPPEVSRIEDPTKPSDQDTGPSAVSG